MLDKDGASKALKIEDYAFIGDCKTAALIGKNGSIDWLCWPHFDNDACFAALLGDHSNGRWLVAPVEDCRVTRSYGGDTMILETVFDTDSGSAAVIDFMPIGDPDSAIVRRVVGRGGIVFMQMHLVLRFEYGSSTPWVTRQADGSIEAVAGAERVVLRSGIEVYGEDNATVAEFQVAAGETVDFTLVWTRSHLEKPAPLDVGAALARTRQFWETWAARCELGGPWRGQMIRSLLTLKALSFAPTGAIVAAPTTSLPESIGGARNWDYRYCWLRDATLTLLALMEGGYTEEAEAWRGWLMRAIAGDPGEIQIMYGLGGERRLIEWEADWLKGYEGSAPVRIGNAAAGQLQLDTFGEVMGTMSEARRRGLHDTGSGWAMQVKHVEHLASIWRQPDDGIWEVRGERRHFTYSKAMAWYAFDCAIRDAEDYGFDAPLDWWRSERDAIHRSICEHAYDADRATFLQSYGGNGLDAALLLLFRIRFLPADDPRMLGTLKAIEEDLLVDGFVLRYRTESGEDGLAPGEGAFLPCSFWLASVYKQVGRTDAAEALFGKLIGLCNDVGLLSEEYDPQAERQLGNFPQAFSHLALIGTAMDLGRAPAWEGCGRSGTR